QHGLETRGTGEIAGGAEGVMERNGMIEATAPSTSDVQGKEGAAAGSAVPGGIVNDVHEEGAFDPLRSTSRVQEEWLRMLEQSPTLNIPFDDDPRPERWELEPDDQDEVSRELMPAKYRS